MKALSFILVRGNGSQRFYPTIGSKIVIDGCQDRMVFKMGALSLSVFHCDASK
jgi:hypothetical protein